MTKQETIKRQIFIVELLRRRPASFQEIDQYLRQKERETDYTLSISQRTFQRDRSEIANL